MFRVLYNTCLPSTKGHTNPKGEIHRMTNPSSHALQSIEAIEPPPAQKTRASRSARSHRSKARSAGHPTALAGTANTPSLQAASAISLLAQDVISDAAADRVGNKEVPRGLETLVQCLRRYVETHPERFVVRDDPRTPGVRVVTLAEGVTQP